MSSDTIETNGKGGKGSKLGVAFHLIPYKALNALARIFHYGAYVRPYGPWNWTYVHPYDHYNHLQEHLNNYRAEMAKHPLSRNYTYIEDELAHALARMTMLYATEMGVDDERVGFPNEPKGVKDNA